MKSSILIVLGVGFAAFGALEVAALNPTASTAAASSTKAAETAVTSGANTQADTGADTQSQENQGRMDGRDSTTSQKSPFARSYSEPSEIAANCLTPELVAAFEPRGAALDARAATLDAREAELRALETKLGAQLKDMETTRDTLQGMTERLDTVAGEDITHLVQMYSTMKPKKASAIFDRMDPAFAAGFLREIDSARAGIIMAEMSEEQSYRVSLLIANRHAEWRQR